MSYGIKEIVLNDDDPVAQDAARAMVKRVAISDEDEALLLMALGLLYDPDAQWVSSVTKYGRRRRQSD